MSLRRQLLLVSLLLLALPWTGCQFIREMESALRQGQEQAAAATARAVASSLSGQTALVYPQPNRRGSPADNRVHLFARPQQEPVILDGYGDGWDEDDFYVFSGDPAASPLVVGYQAVTRGDTLYLLLRIQDARVSYQDPGIGREPNGDRVVLRMWLEGRRQEYVIAPLAPGSVYASHGGRILRGTDPRRIRGHWQDARNGYTVELQLPISMTGGRLGFYVVDVGQGRSGNVATLGNITPLETTAPPWLIYSPTELQDAVAGYSQLGQQLHIMDGDRWQIAELRGQSSSYERPGNETFWLLRALYRRALSSDNLPALPQETEIGRVNGEELERALSGEDAVRWYRDPQRAGYNLLSAAAPITGRDGILGAVLVQSSSEEYLSLTDQAFSKLLVYSLGSLLVAALGLIGYASWLSWRIRRLSRAASEVIAPDGSLRGDFARSSARDEIGDLSRHYGNLLDKVRGYNDYLRSLSHKLSHELRTPIAVIRSSLENLEQAEGAADPVYVKRAKEGLHRLGNILNAMAEANQLEDSLRSNPKRPTELEPMLRELGRAYQALYPRKVVTVALPEEKMWVEASPELLAQALDKLLENANSFCPQGGNIRMGLEAQDADCEIFVENDGPALPPGAIAKLFQPMVSVRGQESDGELHMGLGLHVARLIADYHDGTLGAVNLAGAAGVRFSLTMPQLNGHPRESGGPESLEGAGSPLPRG